MLFLILLAPGFASFGWLHFQKMRIKNEVKSRIIQQIDDSLLVKMTFSVEEAETKLKWKHSKEFEYNHQMYDIVKVHIDNGLVTYWCWKDHKETRINRQIEALVKNAFGNDQQKKEKQNQYITYLKALYCQKIAGWRSNLPEVNACKYMAKAANFYSVLIQPPVPPPRLS